VAGFLIAPAHGAASDAETMPELPEVETTLRGIAPYLEGSRISEVVVRHRNLRWPVPADIERARGRSVVRCWRRAKYILIELGGTGFSGLMIHLGMSGSLRVCDPADSPLHHDHFDLLLDNGRCLRFNDPRRFGSLLCWDDPAEHHPLLRSLGPEPLSDGFSGDYLRCRSRGRRGAVKNFIMDGKVVVGVGNIYASESLFMAGIHPARAAGRISLARYEALASAIRSVLSHAVRRGGTTLRDFVNSEGQPGYFAQELLVYEREDGACFQCGVPIRRKIIGQRSSYYCPRCQR
jgi:formamidopyrimidine-DNA glycosylase